MLHRMRTPRTSRVSMPTMLYMRLSFSRSVFKHIWRGLHGQPMLLIRQM